MRPRAGVFDYGGVMAVSPIGRMHWLAEQFGGSPHDVIGTIFGGTPAAGDDMGDELDNPWHDAERGEIDLGPAFGSRLAARFAAKGMRFDLAVFRSWVADAENFPEPAMVDVVRELRSAGVPTVLLTNSVREFRPVIERTIPVAELFDVVVDSCEVGLRKPQREIYLAAAERVGVPVGECLFLDDHAGNVEGALAVGMPAIHVTDAEVAAAEVRRRFGLG